MRYATFKHDNVLTPLHNDCEHTTEGDKCCRGLS